MLSMSKHTFSILHWDRPLASHAQRQQFLYRGHVFSLKPSQVNYILPGSEYTQVDLESIISGYGAQVGDSTDDLMQTAWEVLFTSHLTSPEFCDWSSLFLRTGALEDALEYKAILLQKAVPGIISYFCVYICARKWYVTDRIVVA